MAITSARLQRWLPGPRCSHAGPFLILAGKACRGSLLGRLLQSQSPTCPWPLCPSLPLCPSPARLSHVPWGGVPEVCCALEADSSPQELLYKEQSSPVAQNFPSHCGIHPLLAAGLCSSSRSWDTGTSPHPHSGSRRTDVMFLRVDGVQLLE